MPTDPATLKASILSAWDSINAFEATGVTKAQLQSLLAQGIATPVASAIDAAGGGGGGGVTLTSAAPETVGTANAVGAATTAARADHVHAHGNQAGGALHSAATSGAAGFMSTAHVAQLDAATAASHSPVSVGTANGLSVASGQVLSMAAAASGTAGALTAAAQSISGKKTLLDGVVVGAIDNLAAGPITVTSDIPPGANFSHAFTINATQNLTFNDTILRVQKNGVDRFRVLQDGTCTASVGWSSPSYADEQGVSRLSFPVFSARNGNSYFGRESDDAAAVQHAFKNFTALTTEGGLIARFDSDLSGTQRLAIAHNGRLQFNATDNSGSPGNCTANTPTGKAAIAAAASSITVTCSACRAGSIVSITPLDLDATLTSYKVAASNGSFVVTGNAAATAAWKFSFVIFNN
jgi:hypothetical protein